MNPELEKAEQHLRLEEQTEKLLDKREADSQRIQSLAFPLLEDSEAVLARECLRLRRELDEMKSKLAGL